MADIGGNWVKRGLATVVSVALILTLWPAYAQEAAEPYIEEEAENVDQPPAAAPAEEEYIEEEPVEEEPVEEGMPVEEEPPAPPTPRVVPPRPTVTRPGPQRQAPIRPQGRPDLSTLPGPRNQTPTPSPLPKGLKAEEPFMIDAENQQLINVIKSVAALTGKNFFFDPAIGQTEITIISHEEFPPDMAFEFLEAVLAANGFSIVETLSENLYRIIPAGQEVQRYDLRFGDADAPEGYDRFFTYVINVEFANAQEIADLLKKVASPISQVDVYPKTNTLLVIDTADGIRNIFALLDVLDQPGYDTETEIFVLQYTRAEQIKQQIQEVLMGTGEAAGPGQPQVVPPRPTRAVRPTQAALPQQQRAEVHGTREEVLRMVTDERLNALIVVATPNMMEETRKLIDTLDTPTPIEGNTMHYVPLLYAKAEEVATALGEITGLAPRGALPGAAPAAGGRGGGGAAPEAAATEVQPFEKKVLITTYEATNSLIIVAAPQDFKLLNEMVARLDVPQRQVNVESIILEVVINNDFQLSVNTAWYDDLEDGFALSNTIDLVNVIANGPIQSGGAGFLGGVVDGTVTIPRVTPGTGGAPPTVTMEIVPNIPLIIRALESITDLDVLSQPSLTTVDNKPAQISVGQQIPVPATLSDTDDRTGFRYRSQIERKDVGVKLNVTPQINEGDYVSLETEVEVSQPIASEIGVDPNQLGATFQRSFIQNELVVKDGGTAIMGGLISESQDRVKRQTPILGDIPGLGFFFRSKGANRRKRNLIVMLTPHIVKEGEDMDRLALHRINEFQTRNFDVMMEHGVINKLQKKHELRNRYSPSSRKREELLDRNRFGRDEIRRPESR